MNLVSASGFLVPRLYQASISELSADVRASDGGVSSRTRQ